ncbi:MAG TPA: polyprenyl synthetase family protein [Candidatus Synoicihabitans sp.]|nr:polyprenyl synthetase family protein [Candidatus Synoicihabitans sp.]
MVSTPAGTSAGSPVIEFATVFARLRPHMAALDEFLRAQIAAFEPEIRSMADYCIDTSGKRIRPALVFLSGWRDGAVAPDLVRVAAVVELVHLATLVHDDIMDGADLRRSRETAARAYGSEAAVLLGDALFSHALHLAAQFPTTDVCLAVSDSTRKVCAGEIVQTLRRGTTNVTRADYFRVIDLKTAELFRISCRLGCLLANYPAEFVEAAATYGRQLGIAYQIYDDLADFFGEERRIGKTLGTDLLSGKLTLPLLVLAEGLEPADRSELMDEIEGRRKPQLDVRLRQMEQLGVFSAVAATIADELAAGEAALAPWAGESPTSLLLSLGDVLRSQVQALRAK